ncbi:predicted protein [Naegleria gruberi]|uniref:Predicted protein n=1 Tax=Naegleria gruberi TaxID=5762 RepID=D2VP76_NAEGR|nr:uncharacterized protein NAEGRDRAFT_70757 [Naegleria gruberi]EFC41312.1 predicted protein [Naegleria gruberi]|eukprot:XP_002674056.1 predicted protein [Naegleria gruberi strain NEG-M]
MKCSVKAQFFLLALIVVAVIVMMIDSTVAQTTTTTPQPEKKQPLSKDSYTKMVQTLDSLMKKLHNQKIVIDKEVNDAKAELELAMKEEEEARKKFEALQKEHLIAKKKTEEQGTKVKELINNITKAQKNTKQSLSDYNRIARDGPNMKDRSSLKKDKQQLKSINDKMQNLMDTRKAK